MFPSVISNPSHKQQISKQQNLHGNPSQEPLQWRAIYISVQVDWQVEKCGVRISKIFCLYLIHRIFARNYQEFYMGVEPWWLPECFLSAYEKVMASSFGKVTTHLTPW